MDDYFAGAGGAQQPPAIPQLTSSGAPAAYPPPPPAWPYPPPRQGMSTGVKVLIGIAIGFGAIIVIGILAAIAIPVFLNQRAKGVAAQTTVSIPSQAAGLALRTDATSVQMTQPLKDLPIPGVHLAGAYGGTTRPEVLVSITKRFMNPGDRRDYLAGSVQAAQRASADGAAQFGSVDPGSLGGEVRCSSAPTMTVCFFADAGAFGSLVVFGTPDRAYQLLPQIRAAVEQRA